MTETSDKNWRAIFTVGALSFLVLAVINIASQAIPPAKANISPDLREAVVKTIKPLSSVDLAQKLSVNEGKPTILTFHASWCPYCRQALPILIDYDKKGYFDNMQVIYLSIDENPEKFIAYLGESGQYKDYVPYLFQDRNKSDLIKITQRYGMSFRGAIPYTVILSADGKILAESSSGEGWAGIDRVVKGQK